MRYRLRQIICSLSLLCYLAASGFASAHVGPMSQKIDTGNLTAMETTAYQVKELAELHSRQADCHASMSPELRDGDRSMTSACKIFCAVMAHAVTSSPDELNFKTLHDTFEPTFFDVTPSQHPSVEPQPPK